MPTQVPAPRSDRGSSMNVPRFYTWLRTPRPRQAHIPTSPVRYSTSAVIQDLFPSVATALEIVDFEVRLAIDHSSHPGEAGTSASEQDVVGDAYNDAEEEESGVYQEHDFEFVSISTGQLFSIYICAYIHVHRSHHLPSTPAHSISPTHINVITTDQTAGHRASSMHSAPSCGRQWFANP